MWFDARDGVRRRPLGQPRRRARPRTPLGPRQRSGLLYEGWLDLGIELDRRLVGEIGTYGGEPGREVRRGRSSSGSDCSTPPTGAAGARHRRHADAARLAVRCGRGRACRVLDRRDQRPYGQRSNVSGFDLDGVERRWWRSTGANYSVDRASRIGAAAE